jgi:hypothetical protein
MTLQISISLETKEKLIRAWGPEVILKCSCGERPSHSMWGQYGSGSCPVCKQRCEMTLYEWGVATDGS